jgi:hypothetical protein
MSVPHAASKRPGHESGQAAVEFVLCMLVVIGLASVLFQALHFELDVYNRSNLARYIAIQKVHDDPSDREPESVETEIQGENIGTLVPYNIPGQDIDSTLHYGPRNFVVRRGTKAFDPIGPVITVALAAALAADHYEDSSGNMGSAASAISEFLNQLQF